MRSILIAVSSLVASYAADMPIGESEPVSTSEANKVELTYYIQYQVQTTGAPSELRRQSETMAGPMSGQAPEFTVFASGTATSLSSWITSEVQKNEEEIKINSFHTLPIFTGTNIARYKVLFEVPDGYAVFSRIYGTAQPFIEGPVVESTLSNAPIQFAIVKLNEAGANAGKMVPVNSGDGEARFSLGFLPSGKSAGYLDFYSDIKYKLNLGPNDSPVGGSVETTDNNKLFRYISMNAEIEVIRPDQSAEMVRQIVAPQAIVDIVSDNYDYLIKYYNPSQKGSRLAQEADASGQPIVYPAGKGPYSFSNESPYLVYRISTSVVYSPTSAYGDASVQKIITIQRTEGALVENSRTTSATHFRIYPSYILNGSMPCPVCDNSSMPGQLECPSCHGYDKYQGNQLSPCPCDNSDCVFGYVDCPNLDCFSGSISYPMPVQGSIAVTVNELNTQGLGANYHSISESEFFDGYANSQFPEGELPSGVKYHQGHFINTTLTILSDSSKRTSYYKGAFPAFLKRTFYNSSGAAQACVAATQKLTYTSEGDSSDSSYTENRYTYYRHAHTDSQHDTHHGRIKSIQRPDGSWQLIDYSNELSSLGRVTKVISPYLDQTMPSSPPAGDSAVGYRITTTTYEPDWNGQVRLPGQIKETANNQNVGLTQNSYYSQTANGEPIWVSSRWTYTENGSSADPLYTETKIYQGKQANGTPVSDWIRGLPFSAVSADGTITTMAYSRGTYDTASKSFSKNSSGLAFRAIVFKGARDDENGAGWTVLSEYEDWDVEPIYLVPGVSTQETTIRDERGFTVRTETKVYTTAGTWVLIDCADMTYDIAGNLIRRAKLNGALYEANYTTENADSINAIAITFANLGSSTRAGRKQYERDELGLITKFYYDNEGRIQKTVRLGLPANGEIPAVPAITTEYEYDADNRIITTTLKGPTETQDIVASKTYDKAGRLKTEKSQGLETKYDYAISNNRITQVTATLPGNVTRITKNYRDGSPKEITGSAVVPEYYTYQVLNSREVLTKHIGTATSSRWSKIHTDWVDRTVLTQSPGLDGSAALPLEQSSYFNAKGQLVKTVNGTLAPTLYYYDGSGIMYKSGLDLDADDELGESDRISAFIYDKRTDGTVWSRYGGDNQTWWSYVETKAYPDNETAGKTVTRTWTRLTNFSRVSRPSGVLGTATSETVTADVHGNRTVSQTYVNPANSTVTTVLYAPFTAQPSITVAVAGQTVLQTSSTGITTKHVYDSLGRLIKTIDHTTTDLTTPNLTYYPGTTRVETATDNRGIVQHTYYYDSAGRVRRDQTPRIDSTGAVNGTNSSYFAYNDRGQLTHVWGDVPYPVQNKYDATYGDRTGLITYRDTETDWNSASLDPANWPTTGDETSFEYFAFNGLLKKKTDAATPTRRSVSFTYNIRGQTETRTWARGEVTHYVYDPDTGELTSTWYDDETMTPVDFTYDRLGRVKTASDAFSTRTFSYRSVDQQLESEAVASSLLGNRTITQQYDATSGRYTGVTLNKDGVSEHAINYSHDPVNGRLKTITTGAGAFRYEYETDSGLIASVSRGSFKQTRAYETNRNILTTLRTDSQMGDVADYDYTSDALGRRTSVGQSGLLYGAYLTSGQIMQTVYGYNDRNEVTSSVTKVATQTLPGRSFGYGFDSMGNRTKETFDGVDYDYTPNELNQYTGRETPAYLPVSGTANRSASISVGLTTLSSGDWTNDYFYKSVAKTGSGSAAHQSITLSASSGTNTQQETVGTWVRPLNEEFEYDYDGNLLSDGLWRYAYDSENRLKSMHSRIPDQTGYGVALFFGYDYLGRRVQKTVWSYSGSPENPAHVSIRSKTNYAYNGWTLLAEYDASTSAAGTLKRRFTFGIDLSGSLGGAGDVGGLLAIEDLRTAYSGIYLAVHDGNGNLTALINGHDGAFAASYEYDPSGNVLRAEGHYSRENPFRFAGKYFDSETGLSYYGHRYYSSSLGRFINRDPIEEAGGLNIYAMAGNDVINSWDVLGLHDEVINLDKYVVTADPFPRFPGLDFGGFADWGSSTSSYEGWLGGSNSSNFSSSVTIAPLTFTSSANPSVIFTEIKHPNTTQARNQHWLFNVEINSAITLATIDLWIKQTEKLRTQWKRDNFWRSIYTTNPYKKPLEELRDLRTDVSSAISLYNLTDRLFYDGEHQIDRRTFDISDPITKELLKFGNATEELILTAATAGVGAISRLAATESRLAPFMKCFPAGTLVLMGDGSAKPIEEIQEGDEVWADDPGDNEPASTRKVTHLLRNWTERLIHVAVDKDGDGKADGEIRSTGEHPFWTSSRGWIAAKDLKSGDLLQAADGAAPTVVSAESVPTTTDTFNLTVDGTHTYFAFAGDIPLLVHNAEPISLFDVRPYAHFAKFPGDGLVGHEMLQNSWLRNNGYAAFRGANPSLALETSFHINPVNRLQAGAGLWDAATTTGQSAYNNIRANIRVLESAGVPRDIIARQAWAAKSFANSLPCR